MLRLNQRITINDKVLPFVQDVEIIDTRNNFTNTAIIRLPNKLPGVNKKISEVVEKGSAVKIELGYFPNLFTEFLGYVSQVIPEKTVAIMCENESYHLKRQSVGQDVILKSITLVDLMTELIKITYGKTTVIFTPEGNGVFKYFSDEISVYTTDSAIGDWKISKTSTIIDVLAELQNKFKIYSYFRFDFLIVGANADPTTKKTITAHFQKNIPSGESSFNFKDASADKIVVKATNIQRDGTINEIFAYYDGSPAVVTFSGVAPTSGAVNEFNIGGQTSFSIADLKVLAQSRLEALSFTGVDGSVTTYPPLTSLCATHGDICNITDLQIPEKNGTYSIVEVKKRFGQGIGYRQDLGLGITL